MTTFFNKVWAILCTAFGGFMEDNALSHSAAIAFFAVTSLAPILLIVIAIAGLVIGGDAAQFAVSAQLSGLLGQTGGDLLESVIKGAANTESGVLASAFAIITLLVAASGVFGEMQSALNQIWKVKPIATNLSTLVRARVASLGLVASLGFLLLVSLVASTAISALGELLDRYLPFGTLIVSIINTVVSVALVAVLFAAIYKVLPDRSLTWRDVRFGAATTAILFTLGKSLIGLYLGTSAVASSYGAAGSLIVLLLWVFYSSAIFLFGAEITRAYATIWGTRKRLRPVVVAEMTDAASAAQLQTKERAFAVVGISTVAALAALITSSVLGKSTRGPRD